MKKVLQVVGLAAAVALAVKEFPALRRELKILKM